MDLITYILAEILRICTIVVILNVILSWATMMTRNYHVRRFYWLTNRLTEPMLAPIRRLLYPYTRNLGIDFSPFLLILLLQFLQRALH